MSTPVHERLYKALNKVDQMLADIYYHDNHEPGTPDVRTPDGWKEYYDELIELKNILIQGEP